MLINHQRSYPSATTTHPINKSIHVNADIGIFSLRNNTIHSISSEASIVQTDAMRDRYAVRRKVSFRLSSDTRVRLNTSYLAEKGDSPIIFGKTIQRIESLCQNTRYFPKRRDSHNRSTTTPQDAASVWMTGPSPASPASWFVEGRA